MAACIKINYKRKQIVINVKKNQTKFQHVMEIIVRRMNCRHDQSEWKKSEAGWATNLQIIYIYVYTYIYI